ncbi:MAG: hypothetical protein ACLGSD_14505 [Acidobacteriota bacterium]
MTLREVLQIELWSKETSRRVFGPVGKILKRAAVVLGVLAVSISVAYVVECNWITSGERKAGKQALAHIEELEKLARCDCAQFAGVDQQVKAYVDLADRKAWTIRDRGVAFQLFSYVVWIETIHQDMLFEEQTRRETQARHLKWQSDPKFEAEQQKLNSEVLNLSRSALHKLLD